MSKLSRKRRNVLASFAAILVILLGGFLFYRGIVNDKAIAQLCREFSHGIPAAEFFKRAQEVGAVSFFCREGLAEITDGEYLSGVGTTWESVYTGKLDPCLKLEQARAEVKFPYAGSRSGHTDFVEITISDGKTVSCQRKYK